MSLAQTPDLPVPAETARVARAAFPKGHPYLALRDHFGPLFSDAEFGALFAHRGRPAESPGCLALVTLLQFAEGLSDRQAADAVRRCVDWKYLLGLELTDPGFHFSILSDFRARLLAGAQELRLFEALLERFAAAGLLKAGGKQRTDSTHVLAAIRNLSRLELAGETLRAALNALAEADPDWLWAFLQHPPSGEAAASPSEAAAGWGERYGRRFEERRLPQVDAQREVLAVHLGTDGFRLLTALWEASSGSASPALQQLPEVVTLLHVWRQQFTREPDPAAAADASAADASAADASPECPARLRVGWRRSGSLPPSALQIHSPYDPEARYSQKPGVEWVGYKEHVTETCEPTPEVTQPLLITDVQTTAATQPDLELLPHIQAALARRQLLPDTQYLDAGYTEATAVVASAARYQVRIVGPVVPDSSPQARENPGFGQAAFTVDWEAGCVVCPRGQRNATWTESLLRGNPVIRVHFADATCRACPARGECCRSATRGRRLTLRPAAEHTALTAMRRAQETEAFRREYAVRAGIEGTHTQAIRVCGLRQCRYLGQAKTHLQHLATAAALNLLRVGRWLLETPRARTREAALLRVIVSAA